MDRHKAVQSRAEVVVQLPREDVAECLRSSVLGEFGRSAESVCREHLLAREDNKHQKT